MHRHLRRLVTCCASLAVLGSAVEASAADAPSPATVVTPSWSSAVGTVEIERRGTAASPSDGDLWPSCWADNGKLYTANGDGKGFSLDQPFFDIAVSEVDGAPPNLTGKTIASGNGVGTIWSGGGFNRKPTGLVCVGNTMYLAVQDLALDFDEAPAATILKSTDLGRTWTWDKSKPMFGDHVFTTIWFADFGKGGHTAPDGYVYAYGLDHNWRFSNKVEDPQDMFLARVPKAKVQDRGAWQFYQGKNSKGTPQWTKRIADKQPVLTDQRRVYEHAFSRDMGGGMSVVSQGGVTYLPKQKRYLYTSWTDFTFEFYESETPWGPWKRFASEDFTGTPITAARHGGYGTTIPSKFISADERSMWLQANLCPCGGTGPLGYNYNLRKVDVEWADKTPAANHPDAAVNLAAAATGAVAISKSTASGGREVLNDGDLTGSENDFDDEVKTASWWGYTWPKRHLFNSVSFTTGAVTSIGAATGGWFTGRPRIQIRKDGQWVDAKGQVTTPEYPGDATAGANQTYTFSFPVVESDGVRVIGLPGGSRTYTSVAEVGVKHVSQLVDGGFEAKTQGGSAWTFEGTAGNGIDRGLGFAHSGQNNAWIRTSGSDWSALTQKVSVTPGKTYTFGTWARSSDSLGAGDGGFGVRLGGVDSPKLGEKRFGPSNTYVQHQVTVTIPPDVHELTVFAGFDAPGTDTWIQLDDFTVTEQ